MKNVSILTRSLLMTLSILLLTGFSAMVMATDSSETTPDESWKFHTIVDAAFVKANISAPMPENVMLIDARPYKPKYVNGHIPGAVNIPDSQFDKHTDLLPADKNALLIYYCEGLKCKLSHKSARKAEKLGYTNVKVFAKGFPEWISIKGNYPAVDAEYVVNAIAKNDTVIVDARPQKPKYDKGHIPTAMNIPFTHFEKLKGKLPMDLNTPVIFYCGGLECRLSHKSAAAAIAIGYTNISVFDKGYPEWKKRYGGEQKIQVKAGDLEGSMDIAMFTETIGKKPESLTIIDVRDADEFNKGSFKTAINIPVDKLEDKIKDLPDDKPIVFVCSTGARSGEAYYMVQDVRPSLKEVYYIEAGVTFKKDGTFEIVKSEG